MARTQVTGYEIKDESITGEDVYEESLLIEKIPFSHPEFVSTNSKDAIAEAKSSSGYVCPWVIPLNTIFTIPEDNQLINVGGFKIHGQLILKGSLVLR